METGGRWKKRGKSLGVRGPSQGLAAVVVEVVSVSLISGSFFGSVHSSESGSSEAGHQSSDPGASLVADKRTRCTMVRAESRWSDEGMR